MNKVECDGCQGVRDSMPHRITVDIDLCDGCVSNIALKNEEELQGLVRKLLRQYIQAETKKMCPEMLKARSADNE